MKSIGVTENVIFQVYLLLIYYLQIQLNKNYYKKKKLLGSRLINPLKYYKKVITAIILINDRCVIN